MRNVSEAPLMSVKNRVWWSVSATWWGRPLLSSVLVRTVWESLWSWSFITKSHCSHPGASSPLDFIYTSLLVKHPQNWIFESCGRFIFFNMCFIKHLFVSSKPWKCHIYCLSCISNASASWDLVCVCSGPALPHLTYGAPHPAMIMSLLFLHFLHLTECIPRTVGVSTAHVTLESSCCSRFRAHSPPLQPESDKSYNRNNLLI